MAGDIAHVHVGGPGSAAASGVGQVLSGLLVFGDVRDAGVAAADGEWGRVGLRMAPLVPFIGGGAEALHDADELLAASRRAAEAARARTETDPLLDRLWREETGAIGPGAGDLAAAQRFARVVGLSANSPAVPQSDTSRERVCLEISEGNRSRTVAIRVPRQDRRICPRAWQFESPQAAREEGVRKRTFFSAALRIVCFIGGVAEDAHIDVYIFTSEDWDSAFERALGFGFHSEESYSNTDGELVEWRFAEVVTLDMIRKPIDGAEVYSYSADISDEDRDAEALDPKSRKPGHSGV